MGYCHLNVVFKQLGAVAPIGGESLGCKGCDMSLEASSAWDFMLSGDNSVSDYDMTTWAS